MKGRTTIELTDAITGIKDVFESDNMVTNALNYFFQGLGAWNSTAFSNETMLGDCICEMLGGILLFDNVLDEDVNNVVHKGPANMVGNGCMNYLNSGDITELGSYNSSESGWQTDGSFKMVYDFNTSQANGTIQSVCLTASTHGKIGEGNSISNKSLGVDVHDFYNPGSAQAAKIDGGNLFTISTRLFKIDLEESVAIIIPQDNIYYNYSNPSVHFSNTGKLILEKYRVPITKYDFRSNLNSGYLIETLELELPEEFMTFVRSNLSDIDLRNNAFISTDSAYLRWSRTGGYIQADDEYKMVKILDDFSMQVYTINNNTGENLLPLEYHIVVNDKILVCSQDVTTNHYSININNCADFTLIHNPIGCGALSCVKFTDISGDRVYFDNVVVDLSTMTLYPRNASGAWDGSGFTLGRVVGNPLIRARTNQAYASYILLSRSENYLATINNLPNPVVKTSDKTMKVTYVLTFDERKEKE